MLKRRTATRLWGAWVTAGCVIEAVTFFRAESGSTLSAHVIDTFRIPPRAPFNEKLRQAITIGFITWLPIHWVSGGKV